MKVTHINDIPIHEYPVFESMLNNTLVRFSKWECAKYWEKKGRKFAESMQIYDSNIKAVDAIIHSSIKPYKVYHEK